MLLDIEKWFKSTLRAVFVLLTSCDGEQNPHSDRPTSKTGKRCRTVSKTEVLSLKSAPSDIFLDILMSDGLGKEEWRLKDGHRFGYDVGAASYVDERAGAGIGRHDV